MRYHLAMCCAVLAMTQTAFSQPAEYRNRGVAPYLVNYGAVQGDRYLAQFAARRFVLVDEGTAADIALMHAANPLLPILLYKDVVALHPSFPEFTAVNRDEHAFLHASDPASLALRMRGDTASITWLADRRPFDSVRYRIYGSLDSAGSAVKLAEALAGETQLVVRIPSSGCASSQC